MKYLKVGQNLIEVEAATKGHGWLHCLPKIEDLEILSDSSWMAQAPGKEWHAAVQLKSSWSSTIGMMF